MKEERSRLRWQRGIEVVGILSVVGSLVFVALEIRQNTNAARSATMQLISEMSTNAILPMVENADLRAAWHAGRTNSMTEDQEFQIRWYVALLLRVQQNRFNQIKLGIIELEEGKQTGGRASGYREPFVIDIWNSSKDQYPADFQQYFERYVLEIPE